MGMKKENTSEKIIRVIKTIFFLITLFISFLLISAPVFLVLADAIVPSALLSASLSVRSSDFHPFSLQSLSEHFRNYDFRYSLIDIPLISIVRSLIIICVYSCCDGPRLSRGPYLWAATMCSLLSLIFVSFKASYVFGIDHIDSNNGGIGISVPSGGGVSGSISSIGSGGRHGGVISNGTELALFVCSYILAVGHVVVAYRTSCRERKKLLVYKIDIEAVSACKNGFPKYQKMLQQQQQEQRKK